MPSPRWASPPISITRIRSISTACSATRRARASCFVSCPYTRRLRAELASQSAGSQAETCDVYHFPCLRGLVVFWQVVATVASNASTKTANYRAAARQHDADVARVLSACGAGGRISDRRQGADRQSRAQTAPDKEWRIVSYL